jgi:hypothetical protein
MDSGWAMMVVVIIIIAVWACGGQDLAGTGCDV